MSWLLHVNRSPDMLQRSLLPQDQVYPAPLFAGGKAYPRPVQNGPLRREGAAETTSWVPGPRYIARRVFAKAVPEREPSEGGSRMGRCVRAWLRRFYALASSARMRDNASSASRVFGCVGPKTRRRLWTTSCWMVSASSRSSPVSRSKASTPQWVVLIQTQVVAGALGGVHKARG